MLPGRRSGPDQIRGLPRPVRYCSKRRSFALCHVSCSCNEHTRCCAENGHKQSLAALLRTATFITRKLSHDFPRTEIERFFNCHPFRSFLVSSRVLGRQIISFDAYALALGASVGENSLLSRTTRRGHSRRE